MKQIPTLSVDLIKQLAESEPELDIRPDVKMEVIMYKSGRRSVINELLYRLEYWEKQQPNKSSITIKEK